MAGIEARFCLCQVYEGKSFAKFKASLRLSKEKGYLSRKGAAALKVSETSGIEGHLRPLSLSHPDVYLHVFSRNVLHY